MPTHKDHMRFFVVTSCGYRHYRVVIVVVTIIVMVIATVIVYNIFI